MPLDRRRVQTALAAVVAAVLAAGLGLTAVPAASADTHTKLRQQRQHAAQLDAKARHQAAVVARSRQRLVQLDAQANAALDALQFARLAADRAQVASDVAQAALTSAQAGTTAARDQLDEFAAGAYRQLASGGTVGATLSLVQAASPQEFLDGLQVLGQVGKNQAGVIDDLRVAEAQQLRSEQLAAAAQDRATAAARGAAIAKQHADALVAEQQSAVRSERRLLAHTRAAAAQAHARARALQRQIDAALRRAAAIRAAQALALARGGAAVAKCDGGSISGYPNGRLPVSALCPLWGAPGMMLQAAAAAAFNRLSRAYAKAFGTPMCVTSSYRTYQKQVELYATMPAGYAAVPGTSTHGWALAVDLCGGVQVDNSPEHNWLLDNAAGYHWFHPAWAMPGGAGPHEPWHWEYAG